jgi:predicted MPP superfamily phosphohydrolase
MEMNHGLHLSTRSVVGLGLGVGLLSLAGAALFYYASKIESKAFRLERLRLAVGGAATGNWITEGERGTGRKSLKILHLSDLHLIEPETDKIAFLQSISKEDVDLVFLTGDIFQNETGLQYATKILSKMPRLGAYAILGNHDYYSYNMINKTIGRIYKPWRSPDQRRDVTGHLEALDRAGFKVLHNDIERFDDEGFSIVGLDYFGIKPEKLHALTDSVPDNQLLLALFHVPKKLKMMSDAGIDIGFGGHTHGGQIRIPRIGALITDSELKRSEASGLIRRGRTMFHISRGMGADPRSNIRLFCPPAATIIEVEYDLT